jgi:putative ATP-dependent endonuclease of the OLD family
MRLRRLRLRNFRCFKDEFTIDFDDLTAIIGRNDAGKSTLLDALAIFFDIAEPDRDDACLGGDPKKVLIGCDFDDLPSAVVVDRDFRTSFDEEHLLNEVGRLEIHKVYDCNAAKPKLTALYARALHPTAKGYADLLILTAKQLKERAEDLKVDLANANKSINAEIRRAIWASAPDLKTSLVDVSLMEEKAKPGQTWEQVKRELPVFALFKSDRPSTDQDEEAQDPMKAAVNEAIKSKEADLQLIEEHVKKEIRALARRTIEKLREIDPKLATGLEPRFESPGWGKLFKISLTGEDQIPINKRGSGVRRMVLLSFFRAKAEQDAGEASVIYAVEELETSQHPHNQRLLLDAFRELTEQRKCQVLLTTHTPTFARLLPIPTLRYLEVRDDDTRTLCSRVDAPQCIARDLGVLADHDVKLFIGVEGKNDESFLRSISKILAEANEDVPDLDSLVDMGEVIFFPLGGSNLALWTSRLGPLNRPEFHLYDRDEEPKTAQHRKAAEEVNNRRDCRAVLTGKLELESYLHPDAVAEVRPEVKLTLGDFDVPMLAARALHEAAAGSKPWDALADKTKKDKESAAKHWLNTDAVARMTAQRLNESDPKGDVRRWLGEMRSMLERQAGRGGE